MNSSEKISYAISVITIGIAILQTVKNYNLKKYIKAEAMETYTISDNLRSFAQACLRAVSSGNSNIVIQEAGRVEGMSNTLFTRSIKNIHHIYNYTKTDIDNWISNNKITASHKDDFLKYAEK